MRKAAFCLIAGLAFCPPVSAAEWLLASQDDFSKIFFDPSSRRALGDGSISVRALTDYDPQSAQAASFHLSERGLSEIETAVFDCARGVYRSEGGSWYADHMAAGAVKSDYPAKTAFAKVPAFYKGLFAKVCEINR